MSGRAAKSTFNGCQSCGVCGVKIDAQDQVHFAYGQPGSRERLYARVCQHVSDRQCINQAANVQGTIHAADAYGSEEDAFSKIDQALSSAAMMSSYSVRRR